MICDLPIKSCLVYSGCLCENVVFMIILINVHLCVLCSPLVGYVIYIYTNYIRIQTKTRTYVSCFYSSSLFDLFNNRLLFDAFGMSLPNRVRCCRVFLYFSV